MDSITPSLTISDAPSTRNLDPDHDFDLVVTLGYMDRFGYGCPDASDTGDTYVFPDGSHDYAAFAAAADRVREALAADQHVLIHCQAGVSRSAGVCIAVLAVHADIPADAAFEQVRTARPRIDPLPEIWASAARYIATHTDRGAYPP